MRTASVDTHSGPLTGLRVVEIASVGPGPFCAMLLADMGADIVRVDRPNQAPRRGAIMGRGRRSIVVDLKQPDGVSLVLQLIEQADVLLEGFRPGVMERLGLGPDECMSRNDRLVYGRMTGWGQEGPYASAPGHDINYIALAGVLNAIGRADEPPIPPLNLIGDYGGGGMLLAFGLVTALYERSRSGRGQVVDAAMVDGAALLSTAFHGMLASGNWDNNRGTHTLDGAAPHYNVYECADGKYVSVGAGEPQFYTELLERLGLSNEPELKDRQDPAQWPAIRARFAEVFLTRTRDEWAALLEGTDTCFAPVLTFSETPHHPHIVHRKTFVEIDGVSQPAPAPRFSRTPGEIRWPAPEPGSDSIAILQETGLSETEIDRLLTSGAVGSSDDVAGSRSVTAP